MLRQSLSNLTVHKRLTVGAAAAAAVNTALVLDLGIRHNYDRLCAVKRGVASANESLLIEQAHDGDAESPTWVAAPALPPNGLVVSPASGANMVAWAAPGARWVRVKFTNGDTAQTALSLELTGYPS